MVKRKDRTGRRQILQLKEEQSRPYSQTVVGLSTMVKRKDRTGRRQILQLKEEQSRPYSRKSSLFVSSRRKPKPTKSVSQGLSSLVTSYDDSDESDSEEAKRKKPAESGNGLVTKDAIDEQLADFLKEIDAISSVSQAEKENADDGQASGSGSGLATDPVPPPPEPVAESEHQELNDKGSTAPKPSAAELTAAEPTASEPTCVWIECMDDTTGYIYYWNQETNEVTWERPPEYEAYLALFTQYQEDPAAPGVDGGGVGGGTGVGSLGAHESAVTVAADSFEAPEAHRVARDEAPSKKRKLEPQIGKIIPITSYGSSDGSSSEESDGGASASLMKTSRLSKRQKGLSSVKAAKLRRSSHSPEALIGPQLPETLIGPQLPEVIIGPQLPKATIGPQLPEAMIGPQLPETMIGPQLPEVTIGPNLPETIIGPQLPRVMIGPQLPEAMIGPQLPQTATDYQLPDAVIGPQLPEATIGPQLTEVMIGPQLPEATIGPQLPDEEIGPLPLGETIAPRLPETVVGPQLPSGDGAIPDPLAPQSPVPLEPGTDDSVFLPSQLDEAELEAASVSCCAEPSGDSAPSSQLPYSSNCANESAAQSPDRSTSALAALVDYPGSPALEEGEIVDDEDEDVCADGKPVPVTYPVMVGARFQFGAAEETARVESGPVTADSTPDSATGRDERNPVSARTSKTSRKSVKDAEDTSRHLVSYGDSESSDGDDDVSGGRDTVAAPAAALKNESRNEVARPRKGLEPSTRRGRGTKKAAFTKIAFVRSDEVLVLSECGKPASAGASEDCRRTESSAESEEVDDFDDVERALDRALMESRKKEAAKTEGKGEVASRSAEERDDVDVGTTRPQPPDGKGVVEEVDDLPTSSDTSRPVATTEIAEEISKEEDKSVEPSVAAGPSSALGAPSVAQAADIERAHGLLMDQLGLLHEGPDQRSSLMDLLVQTRTRMEDWRAGALDPDYLLLKLHETRLAVARLQKAAVSEPPLPRGWQRHWDRYGNPRQRFSTHPVFPPFHFVPTSKARWKPGFFVFCFVRCQTAPLFRRTGGGWVVAVALLPRGSPLSLPFLALLHISLLSRRKGSTGEERAVASSSWSSSLRGVCAAVEAERRAARRMAGTLRLLTGSVMLSTDLEIGRQRR
ncbi:uncharacterized protein ISCGN_010897 [Ixodes scapularis]